MVDSDDEYIQASDDEIDVRPPGRDGSTNTRSKSNRSNKDSSGFEVSRTWENLTEGADGTITGAVEGLLQAGKRQRWLTTTMEEELFIADAATDSSKILHLFKEASFAMLF